MCLSFDGRTCRRTRGSRMPTDRTIMCRNGRATRMRYEPIPTCVCGGYHHVRTWSWSESNPIYATTTTTTVVRAKVKSSHFSRAREGREKNTRVVEKRKAPVFRRRRRVDLFRWQIRCDPCTELAQRRNFKTVYGSRQNANTLPNRS